MARKVRAGLETEVKVSAAPTPASASGVTKVTDVLEQRQFGKPIRLHVKEFGALFGLIGAAVAAYGLYYGGSALMINAGLIAAVLFVGLGYLAPRALYPLWKAWMGMAHMMGAVMTTLILTVAWAVMMVPLAFILRLVGKKVMDLRYKADVTTYWEPREDKLHDFKLLERQF